MSAEREHEEPTDDADAFDLEAEWPEARWFTDDDPDREQLWVLPVFLLYTGFFFGPFVTLLMVVLSLRGRVPVRLAVFLTGLAGTAWCLLQGISVMKGPLWSEYALQGMRSGLNFAFGITAYVTVRRLAVHHFRTSRTTLAISVAVLVVGAVIFVLLPNDILIALGR